MCVRTLISVDEENPLGTIRNLLRSFWTHAKMDGLFIALWQNGNPPQSELLSSPDQLDQADPFAPVMQRNAASAALRILLDHPELRIGFMLRPCELRCFNALLHNQRMNLSGGVLISFDCLATYPPDDFKWKLENSERPEQMSHSALHFALQGGLQPSRYRTSCQFCDTSYPEDADLSFELLGIETSEYIVLTSRSPEVANKLGIGELNGQAVPKEIMLNREHTLLRLADWRQQTFAYATSHLEGSHKTIEGLIAHVSVCSTCRQTLQDYCPYFELDWITLDSMQVIKDVERWLQTCSRCGMCEINCPEGFPLFNVVLLLSKTLQKS